MHGMERCCADRSTLSNDAAPLQNAPNESSSSPSPGGDVYMSRGAHPHTPAWHGACFPRENKMLSHVPSDAGACARIPSFDRFLRSIFFALSQTGQFKTNKGRSKRLEVFQEAASASWTPRAPSSASSSSASWVLPPPQLVRRPQRLQQRV